MKEGGFFREKMQHVYAYKTFLLCCLPDEYGLPDLPFKLHRIVATLWQLAEPKEKTVRGDHHQLYKTKKNFLGTLNWLDRKNGKCRNKRILRLVASCVWKIDHHHDKIWSELWKNGRDFIESRNQWEKDLRAFTSGTSTSYDQEKASNSIWSCSCHKSPSSFE